MLTTLAPGWEFKVDRGPDGLWIRVGRPDPEFPPSAPLADEIWSLLQCHLAHRLVLELEEIEVLNSDLIGQLVLLQKWIRERGGLLRLSGLSSFNQEVLRVHGLASRLPVYENREEAVMGGHAPKPR
jgi:anti-anti-sigma regulatory factor